MSHYTPNADDDPAGLFGSPSPEPVSKPVAAHHTREAQPLVKRLEAGQLDSPLSTKFRVANKPPSPKKPRPGPGRPSSGLKSKAKSSLLTFTKAGPQILKGHYPRLPQNPEATSGPSRLAVPLNANDDAEMGLFMNVDDDNSPSAKDRGPPPTGEELLALAGLNTQAANELEDYEEDEAPAEYPPATSRFVIVFLSFLLNPHFTSLAPLPMKASFNPSLRKPLLYGSEAQFLVHCRVIPRYPDFVLRLDFLGE